MVYFIECFTKIYTAQVYARLCVRVSVCPWADLQSFQGFVAKTTYTYTANAASNAKCQLVLVVAVCLVYIFAACQRM